jgi:rubrerythrin
MKILQQQLEEAQAEIERLRGLLQESSLEHTHQCRKCLTSYTPVGENEDCPFCGYAGK